MQTLMYLILQFCNVLGHKQVSTSVIAPSRATSAKQIRTFIDSSVCQDAYIVGFPWKTERPPLPSNRSICEKRARSLAQKLAHQNFRRHVWCHHHKPARLRVHRKSPRIKCTSGLPFHSTPCGQEEISNYTSEDCI